MHERKDTKQHEETAQPIEECKARSPSLDGENISEHSLTSGVSNKEVRNWILWIIDNIEQADDDDLAIVAALSNHPEWPWRLPDEQLRRMADNIRERLRIKGEKPDTD